MPTPTHIRLQRWIAENRYLVKRLLAERDDPDHDAYDVSTRYLKEWASTVKRGLGWWAKGKRPEGYDPQADFEYGLDAIEGEQR